MFILHDFECTECGHAFEELVNKGDTQTPCPKCGAIAEKQFSGARVNGWNLLTRETQSEKLLKRSSDHTARMAKRGELSKPKGF